MAIFSHYPKTALALILPQLLVTALFFIWPSCEALVQSFFFSDAFGLTQQWAGLARFVELLQDSDYQHAIWVTVQLSVSVTGLTMIFGLFFASLVHARRKSQLIYKTLMIWPYAVAPAVAALLWRFLCHPSLGWVTQLLRSFGVDFNIVTHPTQALMVVIAAASWQQFSCNFLFLFVAMAQIPQVYIEASILDGASPWRRFWDIQFPLLTPTLFFLVTMNLMYAFFDTFGIIDVITQGGPGQSTTTLMYKVYEDGFIGMDPGSSAAQSVVLMLMVVGLTWLQFRYLDKKVHYA